MTKQHTKLWLCLFVATIILIAFLLPRVTTIENTSIPNLPDPDKLPQVRTSSDAVNDIASLEKMIAEIVRPGDWETTQIVPNTRPAFITIVSVLTNGEGCKTYVYDGDGNLHPGTEPDSGGTYSDDNPFGTVDP